jgi:hypothetical protein
MDGGCCVFVFVTSLPCSRSHPKTPVAIPPSPVRNTKQIIGSYALPTLAKGDEQGRGQGPGQEVFGGLEVVVLSGTYRTSHPKAAEVRERTGGGGKEQRARA